MSENSCGCKAPGPAEKTCCPPKPEQTSCCAPKPVESSCCAPKPVEKSCCGASSAEPSGLLKTLGGTAASGLAGWVETPAGAVPRVSHTITRKDVLARWAARWGFARNSWRVPPGLYAFGAPGPDSPALVTCNYKLTFDHLRQVWKGLDAWVVVLDTAGVNVWCAAGKGTFGTEELVRRIGATNLAKVVSHRDLILPQLGAPGVAAHEIKKRTGFRVAYGPVRAADLVKFFAMGRKADRAMREVTFTLTERLILTPVELMMLKGHLVKALPALFLLSGFGPGIWTVHAALHRGLALSVALLVGFFSGAVLTPVLLPWAPGRHFSVKGAVVGCLAALVAAPLWALNLNWLEALAGLSGCMAVTSFVAMNFTGATHYTSPSGVEKEMRNMLPFQVGGAVVALIGWVAGAFIN